MFCKVIVHCDAVENELTEKFAAKAATVAAAATSAATAVSAPNVTACLL